MKLFRIITMVHIVALVCACAKDTEMNPASYENKTRAVADSPIQNVLSFESIEQMERQIHLLLEMSPDEMEAWYTKYNFISQHDALYGAAEEIDDATTLEQAEAIKEKYSPFFLYDNNPANENMYNPYLPNENPSYAYVCNMNGEVNIGGETVNFNTISDVRDTHEYRLTHSVSTRAVADNITETNMLKRTAGKHKFWAEGHLRPRTVMSRSNSQPIRKVRSGGTSASRITTSRSIPNTKTTPPTDGKNPVTS